MAREIDPGYSLALLLVKAEGRRRKGAALVGDGGLRAKLHLPFALTGAQAEADRVAEFTAFRKRMNERILAEDNQVVRRFFALDTQTYKPGALDLRTKEMLGLVASMVLRCDDCISYHVAQCKEAGVTREEMFEVFSVGLVVGGSIVIPHLRRAVDFLDRLEGGEARAPAGHDHG